MNKIQFVFNFVLTDIKNSVKGIFALVVFCSCTGIIGVSENFDKLTLSNAMLHFFIITFGFFTFFSIPLLATIIIIGFKKYSEKNAK